MRRWTPCHPLGSPQHTVLGKPAIQDGQQQGLTLWVGGELPTVYLQDVPQIFSVGVPGMLGELGTDGPVGVMGISIWSKNQRSEVRGAGWAPPLRAPPPN